MKKIIGIIAAVAIAASVFAVDFSAATKISGSLFNYDGSVVKMLSEHNGSTKDGAPNMVFSISDDKAGGSVKLTTAGGKAGDPVSIYAQQIWFKPVDMLKITVGNYGTNLNQEHITWWQGSDSGIGDYGYTIGLYPMDGLSVEVFLAMPEGDYWFDDGYINELSAKFQYGADFGTINAIFQAKGTAANADAGTKAKNFTNLKFGAGYANSFSGINVWANVLGYYFSEKFQRVRLELDANNGWADFAWEVMIPVDIAIEKGTGFWTNINPGNWNVPDPVTVGFMGKVSYKLAPVTVSLIIRDPNFLNKDFVMCVTPGVSGSCGLMGWDVSADITIKGSAVTVDVPVNFTVNF